MGLHFSMVKISNVCGIKNSNRKQEYTVQISYPLFKKATMDNFSHLVLRNDCSVPKGDVGFCFVLFE